jgi:hypothetical protein
MAIKGDHKPAQRIRAAANERALYSIGDLAAEFGISTRAIRCSEAKGLIAQERVGSNRR